MCLGILARTKQAPLLGVAHLPPEYNNWVLMRPHGTLAKHEAQTDVWCRPGTTETTHPLTLRVGSLLKGAKGHRGSEIFDQLRDKSTNETTNALTSQKVKKQFSREGLGVASGGPNRGPCAQNPRNLRAALRDIAVLDTKVVGEPLELI